MALTILSTYPAQGAKDVPMAPGEIEIAFSQKMNRDLTESGTTIYVPADVYKQPESFTKWEERTRVVNGVNVAYDVMRIRFGAAFPAGWPFKITVEATKAKSITNEALAANFVLNFEVQQYDVTRPLTTAVGGDSRDVTPASGYKRAIVLSGGGAKGAFQVGVLKYLYNTEGFYPDLLVGTSVGAVNATKLAEATTVAEHKATITALETLWKSIRHDREIYVPTPAYEALDRKFSSTGGMNLSGWETFLATLPFAGLVLLDEIEDKIENLMVKVDNVRKSTGLYSLAPLRQNWLSAPKLNAPKVFASKVGLLLGAVNVNFGKPAWFDKKTLGNSPEKLQDRVLASAAMPGIFEAMKIDDHLYTDGGLMEVAGLEQAIKAGATDIVVIATYPRGGYRGQPSLNANKYGTLEALLSRTLTELAFDEMLRNDIDGPIKEQEWIARMGGKQVRIRVVEPDLEMHTSLNFNPEAVERNIQHGFDVARQRLGGVAPILPPHPQEQTRTACYLVVNPKWPDGKDLSDFRRMYDYTGGLSEPLHTGDYKDVRIIVREGGKIIHSYPGDSTYDYPQTIVPGSDLSLPDNLNPYLKGRRPGQAYAFPLHAGFRSGIVWTQGNANARPTNLEVEVIYSTLDGTAYKESRSKTNVAFAPDASGVMVHNVTMPSAAPGGGKSRRVFFAPTRINGKVNTPPIFTVHGAGDIADLMALPSADGLLTRGRWECTREVRFLPELKAIRILADDLKVTLFSGPNFTGQSKAMEGDGTYEITFPIRSVKVQHT